VWLYMPVILATQEAETGGSWVLGQPKKRLLDDVRGPRFNSGRQTEREREKSHIEMLEEDLNFLIMWYKILILTKT
jgi:hypothetical protein